MRVTIKAELTASDGCELRYEAQVDVADEASDGVTPAYRTTECHNIDVLQVMDEESGEWKDADHVRYGTDVIADAEDRAMECGSSEVEPAKRFDGTNGEND